MSEFIQYFLNGIKNGAVGQVNYDTNNITADAANISHDFTVVTRRTIGRSRATRTNIAASTRNSTQWDTATTA